MIPAGPNLMAVFEGPDGKPSASRTVVAWADDGHPMVVGERGLLRAEALAVNEDVGQFRRVKPRMDELPPVIAVIPGGGWLIEYEMVNGTTSIEPVVAWTFTSDGVGEAQVSNGGRICQEPIRPFRIYHPDQNGTKPKGPVATWDPNCQHCYGSGWEAVADGEWDPSKHQHAPVRRCRCFKPAQEVTA